MDNVGLMAVVDAGENLLHEHSSVALTELSTLQDLVEKLATFADPRQVQEIYLYRLKPRGLKLTQ